MDTRLKKASALASLATMTVLAAGPAYGSTWGTLWAGARAKGYGRYIEKYGSQAATPSHQYQVKRGDQGVYVETRFQFYGVSSQCGANLGGYYSCFYDDAFRQTRKTQAHRWIWGESYDSLDSGSDRSRGWIKVCEGVSWWPDKCSREVVRGFSY